MKTQLSRSKGIFLKLYSKLYYGNKNFMRIVVIQRQQFQNYLMIQERRSFMNLLLTTRGSFLFEIRSTKCQKGFSCAPLCHGDFENYSCTYSFANIVIIICSIAVEKGTFTRCNVKPSKTGDSVRHTGAQSRKHI